MKAMEKWKSLQELAAWWNASPQKARDLRLAHKIMRRHDPLRRGLAPVERRGEEVRLAGWYVQLIEQLGKEYAGDQAKQVATLILNELKMLPGARPLGEGQPGVQ